MGDSGGTLTVSKRDWPSPLIAMSLGLPRCLIPHQDQDLLDPVSGLGLGIFWEVGEACGLVYPLVEQE